MIHTLRLHAAPFRRISEGSQSIEVRLNDEKRQAMQPGDVIMLISRENPEMHLSARIKRMDRYATFKEVFEKNDAKDLAAEGPDEWKRMYEYYKPEDEAKYGAVAIRIELLQ